MEALSAEAKAEIQKHLDGIKSICAGEKLDAQAVISELLGGEVENVEEENNEGDLTAPEGEAEDPSEEDQSKKAMKKALALAALKKKNGVA